MKRSLALLIVLGLLFAIGCSKKTTGPDENPPEAPQNLEEAVVSVPETAPAEVQAYAGLVNVFHYRFNFYNNFMQSATGQEPVYEDGKWVWTHASPQGNFTITVKAQVLDNGDQKWEIYFSGTFPGPDTVVTVNNWKAAEGVINKDGTQGEWTIYDYNSTDVVAHYTWSTADDGTVTATLEYDDYTFTVINRPDGSGNVKVYRNDTLVFEATWNADGSGQWTNYEDNTQGTWGPIPS